MDIKKIFNPGSSQLRTNVAKIDGNKVDAEILLEKAYTEGIYADTPANRKLGRVGMTYAAYAEKIKKESSKENEDNIKFDLVEAERGIYDLYPNPIELKATSSYVKKISAKDSKSGGIEYEVFLDFKNGKKIDSKSERLNNQTEVKEWIKNKIKEYNKENIQEEVKKEFKKGTLSKNSAGEDFKKEILEAKGTKNFGETALYLADIHSRNRGTYGFLESVRKFIKDNEVEDYFKVEGTGGMYHITSKDGKSILEVAASANGKEIFFREPGESNYHRVGSTSSTVDSYFKKVCKKIEEHYPTTKQVIDGQSTLYNKVKEGLTITKHEDARKYKYVTFADKNSGIVLFKRSYSDNTDIDERDLHFIKNLNEGQENVSQLKDFAEKYNIDLKYDPTSSANISNGFQSYKLGSIPLKSSTKHIYYCPATSSIKIYTASNSYNWRSSGWKYTGSEKVDLSNPKGNYTLNQLVKELNKK